MKYLNLERFTLRIENNIRFYIDMRDLKRERTGKSYEEIYWHLYQTIRFKGF
jgi:hypothetical protein